MQLHRETGLRLAAAIAWIVVLFGCGGSTSNEGTSSVAESDASTTGSSDAGAPSSIDAGAASSGDADDSVPDDSYAHIPGKTGFTFKKALGSDTGSIDVVALAMAKYEVTNARYAAFVTATSTTPPKTWTGNTFPAGEDDYPVNFVSQANAAAYAAWLTSNSSSWTYRLPSEAEWENAARGPNDTTYPWGNQATVVYDPQTFTVTTTPLNFFALCAADALKNYGTQSTTMATADGGTTTVVLSAILSESTSGKVTGWELDNDESGFITTAIFKTHYANGFLTNVGSFASGVSAYGVFDMAGNVWEWTSSTIAATNGGEMGQTVTAIRGGSWFAQLGSCASAYRGEGRAANGAFNNVGFRIVAVPK